MTTTWRVLSSGAFVLTAAVGAAAQQPAAPPAPAQPLTTAKLVGHDAVAGCSKSSSLVNTTEYVVSCSNRTGPGFVEIHAKETDVFYVLDGAATFVTGGTAVNVKADTPVQSRASDITGGVAHHLVKGDVILVPAGQPHWFKEVPTSVSYFVVKVVKP
ncbi:MAG: cupin domain-containing protein [Vicinamibacteraceae bacterium]